MTSLLPPKRICAASGTILMRPGGFEQAEKYFDQIEACCKAIGDRRVRSKAVGWLQDGVNVRRCERHFIFWLLGDRPIIIAVLHERMDFMQRLKDRL